MAIITQLPNELLAQIFEYALTTSDYRREIQQKQEFKLGRGKGDTLSIYRNGHLRDLGRAYARSYEISIKALALARICWRFYSLTLPFLYAELHVDCRLLPISSSEDKPVQFTLPVATRKLHQSVAHNPGLRPLCRRLVLHFSIRYPEVVGATTDLVTWFTAVRTLETHGLRPAEVADPLLHQAVHHMRSLEKLVFKPLFAGVVDELSEFVRIGFWGPHIIDTLLPDYASIRRMLGTGLELQLITDIAGGLKRLRTLELAGVGFGDSKLKDVARTASFTQLKLSYFLAEWDTLIGLVQWPAKLEVFELTSSDKLDNHEFAGDYSTGCCPMGRLCTILSTRRDTLRAIHINHLFRCVLSCPAHPGLIRFDVRAFRALTHLTLSHGDTGTDPRFVRHLLAPRLRVFCWDFTLKYYLGLEHLGKHEEDWLRALAQAAVETGVALHQVKVEYESTVDCYRGDGVYPWDRLERLSEEMAKMGGIALVWNEPCVSRTEFEKMKKTLPFDPW